MSVIHKDAQGRDLHAAECLCDRCVTDRRWATVARIAASVERIEGLLREALERKT